MTGKNGEIFDQRGLLQSSAGAYTLVEHGKSAALILPKGTEANLAPYAGTKRVVHVTGKWGPVRHGPMARLFGGEKGEQGVYVTEVQASTVAKSSKPHSKKAASVASENEGGSAKPSEAKPAAEKAAESKAAEPKPNQPTRSPRRSNKAVDSF